MAIPDKTQLINFINQYVKSKQAERVANKYLNTLSQHILLGITRARKEQSAQNQFPLSLEQIKREIGRFGKQGTQEYWFPLLHTHFPMFKTVTKGNNLRGEQTVATTLIPLDVLIAGQDVDAIFERVYKDLDFSDNTQYDLAPINLKNLKNFIARTTDDSYRTQARLIHMIASATDGALPMAISESSFGRKYYKGINLQSCSKTLREAALGPCWSVDIENAVVNWKYSMMSAETQQQLTYTREYIQDKNRIRKQLADLIFGNTNTNSINTIKRVMTAVGFGARGETNSWYRDATGAWTQGSISEIIYSKELRNKLFTDSWMMHFMSEQEAINNTLEQELRPIFAQTPKLKQLVLTQSGKRLSKQKMIALAYQRAERTVMEKLNEWSNAERILLVHDGAYYRTRPDIQSMQTVLRDYLPEARLCLEQVAGWQPLAEINQEHLDFIQREERAANNGVLPATHGIQCERTALKQYDPHAEPDWETQMMRDFEASLPPEHPEWVKELIKR